MENDDYHFKFKVVVLGDKAVGKTSFLKTTLLPIMNNNGGIKNEEMPNHLKIK